MRQRVLLASLTMIAGLLATGPLSAQAPAADPSVKLQEVLPPDGATRVLAVIAEARARQLPAAALENRALKFAARGIVPRAIEQSVVVHAERLDESRTALQAGRGDTPSDEEIEAGAEALRQGVEGATVSALAKEAPSGRSLAIPLYVIGGLVDRGLPSDEALALVLARLEDQATDEELEQLPAQAAKGQSHKPALTGQALAATKRPSTAGGAPAGIPVNAGGKTRPAPKGRP
jgi:hypothetical protein